MDGYQHTGKETNNCFFHNSTHTKVTGLASIQIYFGNSPGCFKRPDISNRFFKGLHKNLLHARYKPKALILNVIDYPFDIRSLESHLKWSQTPCPGIA
jgi:hypothetical protein